MLYKSPFPRPILLFATLALLSGAGCGSGAVTLAPERGIVVAATPSGAAVAPSPTPTAVAMSSACTNTNGAHLYVNNDVGNLVSYALPLTNASAPTTIRNGSQDVWITFDPACNLYQTLYYSGVSEFASPYTGSAIAATTSSTIAGGDPYGVVVDATGHVFIALAGPGQVLELSSLTGGTIATIGNVPGAYALAFDASGNLYVGGQNGISEFAPPFTGSPVATIASVPDVTGIAFDSSGDLFAASGNAVTVFAKPYGASNVKAVVTTGVATALGISVDTAGNLYVPNYGGNTITAYAPPYTGAPFATVAGDLPDASSIGP